MMSADDPTVSRRTMTPDHSGEPTITPRAGGRNYQAMIDALSQIELSIREQAMLAIGPDVAILSQFGDTVREAADVLRELRAANPTA